MCVVCEKPLTDAVNGVFCSKKCFYESLKVPVVQVWIRDEMTCHLCAKPVALPEASRDHLVPRSLGGPTTFSNVALAHKRCNSRRGIKPINEVREQYGNKAE